VARKYWGEFISIANVNYKVEIWDAPTGSGSGGTELRIVNEGFTIERQGQGDTLFENIVKKSKASVFFAIDNNTDATYFENMATDGEGSHAMIIYKNNAVIWIGRVLSDLFQWQRSAVEGNRIYEITSVDTLSLLDNYKIDTAWFTSGKITLLHLITSILKVTELDAYWGAVGRSGYFVADALLTYENSSGTNYRLPRFRINAASLIKNYDPTQNIVQSSDDENEDNITCLKALEKVLGNFAAYIILENGMYFVHQYAAYTNSIIYDSYSTTETLTATNTVITHEHTISNSARPFLEAFPTHSYQPAIKKIKLTTHKAVSKKVAKTWRTPYNNSHLSIGPVTMTEDKSVKFNFYINFIPNYRDVYVFKYRAWAQERSTGNKYTWSGTAWVLTPTVAFSGNLKIDLPFRAAAAGANPYSHQYRLSYSVPDNSFISGCDFYAEMYLLQNVQTPGSTTIIDADFTGSITVIQELNDNLTTYNNINNTKASKVIDLDSYYYDGFGSDSIGSIQVYDGTNWSNSDSWIAAGPTSGSFENIYAKQVLGFYSKAVKSVKTNVRDNGAYNGLRTLVFDSSIWVSNGYTYNAMSETYDGEWLKLYGDYTAVESGDTEYYNNPATQNEFRIQELESQVDAMNGAQTNVSQNLSSNLFIDKGNTNPTIDTRYSVSVYYQPSIETSTFELQELGSLTTLTTGTHTASVSTPSYICNTTDGNITINLPAADTCKGIEFWFKKTTNPHSVIVNGTIDGLSHHDITNQNGSIVIVSDGSVYWIKSHY
jgi:hypothetical protein